MLFDDLRRTIFLLSPDSLSVMGERERERTIRERSRDVLSHRAKNSKCKQRIASEINGRPRITKTIIDGAYG